MTESPSSGGVGEASLMIMKKKKYIAPVMEIAEIEMVSMIAASAPEIGIIKPGENGENTGTDILSNNRRGTWGNLWAND